MHVRFINNMLVSPESTPKDDLFRREDNYYIYFDRVGFLEIFARIRGEPLELVARETNVSIARLSDWRERALAGAATALKERERDDRDDEIARLKSKVGEITMDNELLYAKIEALEGKRPLAHRRSRR